MEARQEEARKNGTMRVKLEPTSASDTEARIHLPAGVPRVTGLGTEHLEAIQELASKGRLGWRDFQLMVDLRPLFKKVLDQLHAIELNGLSEAKVKDQIRDAFRASEEELVLDLKEEMEARGDTDNNYDFNDNFLVPDGQGDEKELKAKKCRTPDALDLARCLRTIRKNEEVLRAHAPHLLRKIEEGKSKKKKKRKLVRLCDKNKKKEKKRKVVEVAEVTTKKKKKKTTYYGTNANPIEL